MTEKPPGPRPIKPKGDIRLLFVADLSSHAREPFISEPATPEQLERIVDHFALSGADAFGQEVFGQGWVLHFYGAPTQGAQLRRLPAASTWTASR